MVPLLLPSVVLCVNAFICSVVSDSLQPPGPSVHGIFQQEYWNGLPFPSPGDLPNPAIETKPPALAGRFFTTEPSPSLSICSVAVEFDSLRPHGLQHARLPCLLPSPRAAHTVWTPQRGSCSYTEKRRKKETEVTRTRKEADRKSVV